MFEFLYRGLKCKLDSVQRDELCQRMNENIRYKFDVLDCELAMNKI